MKTAEIRQAFLDYFHKKGHEIVPSSSLVPAQDPTLLFTNAGMVQFKDVFLGLEKRDFSRAVSVQRCVRAGGKHNDLENVGYTARHHTFFEMLGFFSFGDYFKRQAIQYAWEFLTEVLKLPAEKLWITVYQDDDEAAKIWLDEIKISPARFSRCGEKDNFWSMGDTGPCGPCTEIFYDHGPDIPGGPPGTPEADGDRYIEIWNLVFMQFNRDKAGQLHPLPRPSVDTGMGLERLAAVVQGVHANYEIDDFKCLIEAILKLSPQAKAENASVKVIADHLRACAFLICDGVIPSNEGRGYVLRRIMRRAIRHAHYLGIPTPFFAFLLPVLVQVMGEAYPELAKKQSNIAQVMSQEEVQFAKTLDQGLRLLHEAIQSGQSEKILSGEVAFKLYDTYGFPLDLTEDILREKGWQVDRVVFDKCMQVQRAQSQARSNFTAESLPLLGEQVSSEFKGYELTNASSSIQAIAVNDQVVAELAVGDEAWVVLATTPFYAESGGQVGDTGKLVCDQTEFEVQDTKRQGNVILHFGRLKTGQLRVGQIVEAQVDVARRDAIRLNHTATHLLHAALKQFVGEHIEQRGSLVEALRARFDFSYPSALTAAQLSEVERLVNAKIRENIEVTTQIMPIEEARQSGAVALFDEKYANNVRVLTVGTFSKELCGGTHVKRTGDIGYFKITAEYGIASGVRRIEMVTGEAAFNWTNGQLKQLEELAGALKTNRDEVKNKVLQLLNDIKERESQLAQMRQKIAHHSGQTLTDKVEEINGIKVLIASIEGADMQGLRATLDKVRSTLESGVVVLYTLTDGRMNLVVSVSRELLTKLPKAAELAKILCEKAGGRDDMAQGGGEIPQDLEARIEKLKEVLSKHD
jgi:alanyl-tRNA synthetase